MLTYLLSNYLISGFHIAPWLKQERKKKLHWDLLTPCGGTETMQYFACFKKNSCKSKILCKEGILYTTIQTC